jgi:hypothetical protein
MDSFDNTAKSPSQRRRACKFGVSRRRMKKVIRAEEARVASRLTALRPLPGESIDPDDRLGVLGDFEWFLTWRLKTGCGDLPLWCDGVNDLILSWQSPRTVSVSGTAFIGPEDDVSRGCKRFSLTGSLTLDSRGRRLKSYSLVLARGIERYLAIRQSN